MNNFMLLISGMLIGFGIMWLSNVLIEDMNVIPTMLMGSVLLILIILLNRVNEIRNKIDLFEKEFKNKK